MFKSTRYAVMVSLPLEAVGVVGVVLEVAHPDTNKDTTTSERTNIAVIGFNCIMLMQEATFGLTIPIRFFQTEEPRSQP